MVWSRVTSVMAMVLLLGSCYVDGQEKEQVGQVKGLGAAADADASSAIIKYAFTHPQTGGRVVQIIKINYETEGTPTIIGIEVKNPADTDPVEVIDMMIDKSQTKRGTDIPTGRDATTLVFQGQDSSGHTYIANIISFTTHVSGQPDRFIQASKIIINNEDKDILIGKYLSPVSKNRWKKHTTKNPYTGSEDIPITAAVLYSIMDNKAELRSKCSRGNFIYSDDAGVQKFTYTRDNEKCRNEKLTYYFYNYNLGKLLTCLDKCNGERFSIKDYSEYGSSYGLDCDAKKLDFFYERNGLKIVIEDRDGMVDVVYSEDC